MKTGYGSGLESFPGEMSLQSGVAGMHASAQQTSLASLRNALCPIFHERFIEGQINMINTRTSLSPDIGAVAE